MIKSPGKKNPFLEKKKSVPINRSIETEISVDFQEKLREKFEMNEYTVKFSDISVKNWKIRYKRYKRSE